MIHKTGLHSILISTLLVTVVCALTPTNASAQKKVVNARVASVQQPLYSEYKGVRLGMSIEEVRAKLGKPALGADDQDYYIISQTETVQIAYDGSHKAKTVSVDFMEGIGAPDYKAVVGPDVETRPDGSIHKLVTYESAGCWVAYNRSAGGVTTVTITIQKIMTR